MVTAQLAMRCIPHYDPLPSNTFRCRARVKMMTKLSESYILCVVKHESADSEDPSRSTPPARKAGNEHGRNLGQNYEQDIIEGGTKEVLDALTRAGPTAHYTCASGRSSLWHRWSDGHRTRVYPAHMHQHPQIGFSGHV